MKDYKGFGVNELRKWTKSKNIPLEDYEQQCLVQYLLKNKYDFFAPINENSYSFLNKKIATIIEAKMKSMGKLKGVLDIVIFLPEFILFMEMKRRPKVLKSNKLSYTNSKVSTEQYVFMDMLAQYKYTKSVVVYGYDEAIAVLKSHDV